MPTTQPTTPRLWPLLVAVGLALVAAVLVVAVSTSGGGERERRPLGSLSVLVAVRSGERTVRAVTEDGGCRRPVLADVQVRADLAVLRVIGQSSGGGCTADVKVQCNEVRLPAKAAGKRLVAVPVAARAHHVDAAELARVYASGACPRLGLR